MGSVSGWPELSWKGMARNGPEWHGMVWNGLAALWGGVSARMQIHSRHCLQARALIREQKITGGMLQFPMFGFYFALLYCIRKCAIKRSEYL